MMKFFRFTTFYHHTKIPMRLLVFRRLYSSTYRNDLIPSSAHFALPMSPLTALGVQGCHSTSLPQVPGTWTIIRLLCVIPVVLLTPSSPFPPPFTIFHHNNFSLLLFL